MKNSFTLESYIENRCDLISQKMAELIAYNTELPYASLFEAAHYSLSGTAKRLRPLLVLATAETFGAPFEKALIPAIAIELVHTYSLIHDDLPCMDDDDMRRGKPSLHKAYSEGHAVLTGDFLLTYAFEILAHCPELNETQKLLLIQTLTKSAGADGMIGGQVLDLAACGVPYEWETLQLMHLKKTASLITASLLFGGHVAQISESEKKSLESIGNQLGLAFQIIDDLLDGHESTEKTTALTILGMERAKALAEELFESASTSLFQLNPNDHLLPSLAKKLIHRTF